MNLPSSQGRGEFAWDSEPFPGLCPIGRLAIRNPFRLKRLPRLCNLHLLLHHEPAGSRLRDILYRWFERKVYRRALAHPSPEKGEASLLVGSEWRDFSFNSANSQFESIYAPAFGNAYEPETAVLIDALLPDDGVMLDIGANWGHVSLFAASRPGFHGTIHAFEPMPGTYADLVSTVNETRMGGLVKLHQVALANHEGVAHMAVPDGEQSGLASFTDKGGSPVQVTRLDLLDLPGPDLMKIDVEGHEADMLRGARETIQKTGRSSFLRACRSERFPWSLNLFKSSRNWDTDFFCPLSYAMMEGGSATRPTARMATCRARFRWRSSLSLPKGAGCCTRILTFLPAMPTACRRSSTFSIGQPAEKRPFPIDELPRLCLIGPVRGS